MQSMTEIIDSRDLIERRKELEAQEQRDEEEEEEFQAITELENEGIPDWQYGAALIREDYFTEYAQQLAEDIGAIDPNASWPLSYIDWEAAANALKMDYMEIIYQGQTYFVRA